MGNTRFFNIFYKFIFLLYGTITKEKRWWTSLCPVMTAHSPHSRRPSDSRRGRQACRYWRDRSRCSRPAPVWGSSSRVPERGDFRRQFRSSLSPLWDGAFMRAIHRRRGDRHRLLCTKPLGREPDFYRLAPPVEQEEDAFYCAIGGSHRGSGWLATERGQGDEPGRGQLSLGVREMR